MTWPQSTAHTMRCTLSLPLSTETSAICALKRRVVNGDAVDVARGQRLALAGFFGGDVQHVQHARRFAPAGGGAPPPDLCRRPRISSKKLSRKKVFWVADRRQ